MLAVLNNVVINYFDRWSIMEQVKKTRAKGAGRKPLPPEDRAKVTSLRLTEAQLARFIELGGIDWLRHQLDKQQD
jgi:hypothetical protein